MTTKVAIFRKWTEPIPIGCDGKPIPKNLWPRRRKHAWVVRWFARGPTGKTSRPSKTFALREDADAFRASKQTEFVNHPSSRRVQRQVTLKEFMDELIRLRVGPRGQRLKATTLNIYSQALKWLSQEVGWECRISQITPTDIVHVFSRMGDAGRSRATINRIKRTLRAAFGVACSPLAYLKENPLNGMRQDRVPDIRIRLVSTSEFAAMLGACESPWWRAFFLICYSAGLRLSEAMHLTWADIDFSEGIVWVKAKVEGKSTIPWTPKDYETRAIPIPDETISVLSKLQSDSGLHHPYIFLAADRLKLVKASRELGTWREDRQFVNNFHRAFRRLVIRASKASPSLIDDQGIPTISMHDLRRTAITNWSKIANIQTVMQMAGHSNIETTRRYYAATTDDQIKLIREASAVAVRAATKSRQTDPKVTPDARKKANSTARLAAEKP